MYNREIMARVKQVSRVGGGKHFSKAIIKLAMKNKKTPHKGTTKPKAANKEKIDEKPKSKFVKINGKRRYRPGFRALADFQRGVEFDTLRDLKDFERGVKFDRLRDLNDKDYVPRTKEDVEPKEVTRRSEYKILNLAENLPVLEREHSLVQEGEQFLSFLNGVRSIVGVNTDELFLETENAIW